MNRFIGQTILLVTLVHLLGCRQLSYEETEVDFSERTLTSASSPLPKKKLRFALAAMISPKETYGDYAKLVKELGGALGQQVVMSHGRTYKQVNALILGGKVDIAFICTGGYLELRRQAPASTILVVPRVKGRITYRSFVIARKESRFGSFEDLKDRHFAFTDPLSNTGYFYPSSLLQELNTDKDEFFASYVFVGSHDRAINAVRRGLRDAAAVDSLVYDYIASHKPEAVRGLHVLNKSPDFGMPPIVAPPGIPRQSINRWRSALLRLHKRPAGIRIMKRLAIEQFVVPPADLYRSAEKQWRRLQ